MNSMILYIGSEHVIQEPHFDLMQDSLRAESDRDTGTRKACQRDYAGVLNTYRLDLQSLNVIQQSEGADSAEADVVICKNPGDSYVSIRSQKALKQLSFLGACFVTRSSH